MKTRRFKALEEKILTIIENNGDLPLEQLAIMTDMSMEEVAAKIDAMKEKKVILGQKTIINWDKTSKDVVTALIELKVTPQRGEGFDKIAEKIYKFQEVQSLYLVAGTYDLLVTIEHDTMQKVAHFVSSRLATMDSVVATSTHFILKKYKYEGFSFEEEEKDTRQVITI